MLWVQMEPRVLRSPKTLKMLIGLSARPARSSRFVYALLLMLVPAAFLPAAPFAIKFQSGGGTLAFTVPGGNLPTVPGTDISVTTYTSPAGQDALDVTGGWAPGNAGWDITVHKVDSASPGWSSQLHLWIKWTAADVRVLGNENVYQEITGSPATLCYCTTARHSPGGAGILCTYELRNVSCVAGMTNSTTVYFTATETF